MKTPIDIKRYTLYLWIGLAYLLICIFSDHARYSGIFVEMAFNDIWRIIFITILNYFLFEYTLAGLSRKKILLTALLILVHISLYSGGLYLWRAIGIKLKIYFPLQTYSSLSSNLADQMKYSMMSILFFGIIRHVYNHIKLKQAAQQLRIEKQQAELNFLKSQTNPHFLFNTLNNIYSLSRDKSDLAPGSILRLSKILRFMLYETGCEYIVIEQELKIINDYIALEKLRYDDSLQITFIQDIGDMKEAIPPLLLIPLVENAFKHGVSETRVQPFVDIYLSVKKQQLLFIVKNSAEGLPGGDIIKENIGLSNLRRQLELLYRDFTLSIQQKESVFAAILKINLATHV